MQIHNLVQGTPEWEQFRLTHFGASEAAAMLGLSDKVKRTELLHMKHTGVAKAFSDWVQENILDHGHAVEALARPLVEEDIGDDLYPVTCSDGVLSASCDGLTMGGDTAFEHKQWNVELAAMVEAGIVPDTHMPQCQQILLVTGAQRVRFVVSDGTRDRMVFVDVLPDQAWFERIRAGWTQFQKDLDAYTPAEIIEKPEPAPIMALPTLSVQIRGEVVATNLPMYREAAERFIASINREPSTDEDFANAEATVKFCEEAEKKLVAARDAALAQTSSIDELMRTIDHVSNLLRATRLDLDKLVKRRKEEIKADVFNKARDAYSQHLADINAELRVVTLNWLPSPDFAGAGKNKRTIATLQDAVSTCLANAKIAADASAKEVRAKLAVYQEHADHHFLFSDLQQLIQKPMDDFRLTLTSRIEAHVREQQERANRAAQEAVAQSQAESAVESTVTGSQSPMAAPAPSVTPLFSKPRAAQDRPTDDQIIDAVALHFRVHESKAIEWLMTVDLKAAGARLAAAF
jgi:predicted phage-related endonuclease